MGASWFSYLIRAEIPFVIRVKKSYNIFDIKGDAALSLGHLLKKCGRKKKVLNVPIKMWEYELYLSFRKGTKGTKEPMVLVSNFAFPMPFDIYKIRWEIETLFSCLKSRGFHIEDTHVTDPEKVEKVLFVLTIAFCWAYKIGEWKAEIKPIPQKTHGRKQKSLFRYGLDSIQRASRRIQFDTSEFLNILKFLNSLFRGGCNA